MDYFRSLQATFSGGDNPGIKKFILSAGEGAL